MAERLTSRDGHRFRIYRAGWGQAGAGLVVVQEIFGLNSHIRGICDRFAEQGYQVVSPALFDRLGGEEESEFGVELGYGADDLQRGAQFARQVGYVESPLLEIEACLKSFAPGTPVGVVGFCWGGTLAWLSAVRLPQDHRDPSLRACVGYYGGMIARNLADPPRVPIMLHFGENDPYIPLSEVTTIRRAYPDLPVFVYAAGHGFNCEQRPDYEPAAASLAWQRTLEFLARHLQGQSPA